MRAAMASKGEAITNCHLSDFSSHFSIPHAASSGCPGPTHSAGAAT